MLTSDSRTKMTKFLQNCWGATSFWLSTSVWESLLNAKEFYFSSCFCMNLTWASHTHEEKSMFLIILKRLLSFWTKLTLAQACDCWPKYTTSRLNLTTSRGGLVCLFVTQIQVEWNNRYLTYGGSNPAWDRDYINKVESLNKKEI